MTNQVLAFSAPGKAFLAGGYLVLFPEHSAYVVALSARMHAVVQGSNSAEKFRISVKSPQFKDGEWIYENGQLNRKNPFVEAVVKTILNYISPTQNHDVTITIYSDDAYHSQSTNDSSSSKGYTYHSLPISEVPKTGLGSSAALTVVLITALLSYFKGPYLDLKDNHTSRLIHNLAQISHSAAQGKIGSGFDVAAATYGSIVYKRFPSSLLTNAVDTINNSSGDRFSLKPLVEQDWEMSIDKCKMPPGLTLLMGDIKGGSETPKMVSTVLKWKETNPIESSEIWTQLDKANMTLVSLLTKLNEMHEKSDDSQQQQHYKEILNTPSEGVLSTITNTINVIRKNLRLMSEKSGVPIEPPEQTELLDACSVLPGVLGGVVPGAGGYDAICLVVLTDRIDEFQKSAADSEKLENVQWLNLREEGVGVRQEDPQLYPN